MRRKLQTALTIFVPLVFALVACTQPGGVSLPVDGAALLSDADIDLAILDIGFDAGEFEVTEVDLIEADSTDVSIPPIIEDGQGEPSVDAVLPGADGWLAWVFDNPAIVNRYRIRAQDQSGGGILTIYSGRREIQSVAVSSDGDTFVFSMRPSVNPANDFEIYQFVKSTGILTRLTNNGVDDTNISTSGDATVIVYEAGNAKRVVRVRTGGSTTNLIRGHDLIEPSVSEDGDFIALIRRRPAGTRQVALFNRGAGTLANLTRTSAIVRAHPSPSNGGAKVAYLQMGSPDRVKLRVVAGGTSTVMSGASLDHPHLASNGIWLTVAKVDVNGNFDVFTKDLSTGMVRRTTRFGLPKQNVAPYWQVPAAGPPPGGFEITVLFPDSSLTASQQAIFTTAANRWAQLIVGDLTDVIGFSRPGTDGCTTNPFSGNVDDVVIEATAPAIDGEGGILGQAGPCYIRSSGPAMNLPVYGRMAFDIADVAALEAAGELDEVIVHEMAHVLGLGTLWDFFFLRTGVGGADPRFTGANALAEYSALTGSAETSIPLANTGGPGTQGGHWREAIFDFELFTGFLNSGVFNPISRMSVASFEDMTYTVNKNAADPYSLPGCSPACLRLQGSGVELGAILITPIAGVTADGMIVPLDSEIR